MLYFHNIAFRIPLRSKFYRLDVLPLKLKACGRENSSRKEAILKLIVPYMSSHFYKEFSVLSFHKLTPHIFIEVFVLYYHIFIIYNVITALNHTIMHNLRLKNHIIIIFLVNNDRSSKNRF